MTRVIAGDEVCYELLAPGYALQRTKILQIIPTGLELRRAFPISWHLIVGHHEVR